MNLFLSFILGAVVGGAIVYVLRPKSGFLSLIRANGGVVDAIEAESQ